MPLTLDNMTVRLNDPTDEVVIADGYATWPPEIIARWRRTDGLPALPNWAWLVDPLVYGGPSDTARRAIVRYSDGYVACVLVGGGDQPYSLADESTWEVFRRTVTCSHGTHYGTDTCSHTDGAALEYCGDCGESFHPVHHHHNPTGNPDMLCRPCGEYHRRCTVMVLCAYCGEMACEMHAVEHAEEAIQDIRNPERIDYRHTDEGMMERGKPVPRARGGRLVGIELEAEWETCDPSALDALPRSCGIATDGSLKNGIEVQTHPASGDALVEVVEKSTRAMRDAGLVADGESSCGLHVHLDLRDWRHDAAKLARVYGMFYALEPMLYGMQEGDRGSSGYCYRLEECFNGGVAVMARKSRDSIMADYHGVYKRGDWRYILEAVEHEKYHDSRYRGTNFHSVAYRGTLEIRIHEGTLDANRILAWVDLLQSVLRACEDDRWPGWDRLRTLHNATRDGGFDGYKRARRLAHRIMRFTPQTRDYILRQTRRSGEEAF